MCSPGLSQPRRCRRGAPTAPEAEERGTPPPAEAHRQQKASTSNEPTKEVRRSNPPPSGRGSLRDLFSLSRLLVSRGGSKCIASSVSPVPSSTRTARSLPSAAGRATKTTAWFTSGPPSLLSCQGDDMEDGGETGSHAFLSLVDLAERTLGCTSESVLGLPMIRMARRCIRTESASNGTERSPGAPEGWVRSWRTSPRGQSSRTMT